MLLKPSQERCVSEFITFQAQAPKILQFFSLIFFFLWMCLQEKQEENELRALPAPSPAQLRALDSAVLEAAEVHGISEEDFALRQTVVLRMEGIIRKQLTGTILSSQNLRLVFSLIPLNIFYLWTCDTEKFSFASLE